MKKTTARNLASLYGIQIASLVLPLITIPYLARVLTPEGMGSYATIHSLSMTLAVLIEYGFVFSATRAVASCKGDSKQISEIANRVLCAKIFLSIVGISVGIILGIFVEQYGRTPSLLAFGILYAIAQGFSPLWYFQGVERLQQAAIVEMLCKFLGTLLIFIFVKHSHEAWLVLCINFICILFAVVFNHIVMYRYISWISLSIGSARKGLKDGLSMFAFRASVSLYTTANAAILSFFVPASAVANYANAERLIGAGKAGLQPVSQLLFPRISKVIVEDYNEAVKLLHRSSRILVFLSISIAVIVWISSPYFVPWFLGEGYDDTVKLMRLLSFSIPLVACSNILGIQWMLPNNMDNIFNTIISSTGILNIIIIVTLVPHFGSHGMVYSVLISECLVIFLMLSYLSILGRLPLFHQGG